MACGCNKGKVGFDAQGNQVAPLTHRVMVAGRQVYESTQPGAAAAVAARFDDAKVLAPGETA